MLNISLYSLSALALLLQSNLPLNEVIQIAPAEEISEEAFSTNSFNYLYPPETIKPEKWLEAKSLSTVEELEFAALVNRAEKEFTACQDLRIEMEIRMGDQTGPHTVHRDWVQLYKNCLKARRKEVNQLAGTSQRLQKRIISESGDEGATTRLDLIYKLQAKTSNLRQEITEEFRTQKEYVKYYNTGARGY